MLATKIFEMLDFKYCLIFFPQANKSFVIRTKHKRLKTRVFFFSQVNANTRGRRRTAINKLKEKWINENKELTFKRRVFIKFPEADAHKDHFANEVT